MKEYDEKSAEAPAPYTPEQLDRDKARIAKLERQLECEREFFLDMMYAAGNCAKCRFFPICGPEYECRKTLTRKLRQYVKKVLG